MLMIASLETTDKKHTVAEWLELEERSDVRHEFYYGKLIPMPGEAKKANRISGNFYKLADDHLLEKGFDIFFQDVKAEVVPDGIYRYPDLVVAPISDNEDEYIVKQPVMIVEVASKNSMYRDQVKKRREYFQVESMLYYLIVSQDDQWAELHSRNGGGEWNTHYFTEPEDVIELKKLGLEFTLGDLYKRVVFNP